MTRRIAYRVLGILLIVAIFVVGLWLGRLYSAAGGPGAVALQQFGSNVIRQIRQLWEPSTSPTDAVDEGFAVSRISLEQLKEKLDAGDDMVIVDVRSKDDFDAGHIVGAISIPWEEIEDRLTELSRDEEIITYCGRC